MPVADLAKTRRCACGNIRRTARALTRFYDEIMQPAGMSITQFSLLANIARAGSITTSQLAEVLVMDQTTVTRNLKSLESQSWITREVGQDQRTRLLRLTEAGQTALEGAMPCWEQAQAQVIERFGQDRLINLLKELSALAEIN